MGLKTVLVDEKILHKLKLACVSQKLKIGATVEQAILKFLDAPNNLKEKLIKNKIKELFLRINKNETDSLVGELQEELEAEKALLDEFKKFLILLLNEDQL